MMPSIRTGIGFDAHKLNYGIPLIIGGVHIEHDKGLEGHSDGDVLIHAIIDSILGAASLGDIGNYFSSDDSNIKGVSSGILLERVREYVATAGYGVVFVDATIIAQNPTMKPHIINMESNIASNLGFEIDSVNIKATTTDGLGVIGKEEGIACMSVATLEKII